MPDSYIPPRHLNDYQKRINELTQAVAMAIGALEVMAVENPGREGIVTVINKLRSMIETPKYFVPTGRDL